MDLFDTLTFAEILGRTTFLDTLSLTVLISIPLEQHSHFENHLSLLQDTGSKDDHME
jgi:hypothetical protein